MPAVHVDVTGVEMEGSGVWAKRGELTRIVPIKAIVRFFKIAPPSKSLIESVVFYLSMQS
jgi:hypothetical protein